MAAGLSDMTACRQMALAGAAVHPRHGSAVPAHRSLEAIVRSFVDSFLGRLRERGGLPFPLLPTLLLY